MRELKLFNGRPYGPLPQEMWTRNRETAHIYVAAYSVADARRVCVEAGVKDPGAYEISKYWSEGSWGNLMAGIPVSRGIWVIYGHHGAPEKLERSAASAQADETTE